MAQKAEEGNWKENVPRDFRGLTSPLDGDDKHVVRVGIQTVKHPAGHTDWLCVLHYSHFSAEPKVGRESPPAR